MNTRTLAAWIAAGVVIACTLAWAMLIVDRDDGTHLGDVVGAIVLLGGPPAVAVWLVVRHAGAAMRDRRLAIGFTGMLIAVLVGTGLAAITLVSSRASLAGDQSGSLFYVVLVVTPVVLLVVACGIGFARDSLRAGVEVGLLAALGALVGIVAVAMPEGARWAQTAGVFMLDGDTPLEPLTARAGAVDALRSTLVFGLITWLPWPVIGAVLGAATGRRWRSSRSRSPHRG
jgi:hypothetical protein